MKSTLNDKINITLFAVAVFIIVSVPFTYKITDKLFSMFGIRTLNKSGSPSMMGLVLHTIVFALIVFASMYIPLKPKAKTETKTETKAEAEAETEAEQELKSEQEPVLVQESETGESYRHYKYM